MKKQSRMTTKCSIFPSLLMNLPLKSSGARSGGIRMDFPEKKLQARRKASTPPDARYEILALFVQLSHPRDSLRIP